jgi:general secretion pathway protein K
MVSRAEEKVDISPFMANRITDWIDPNLNSLADGAEDLDYLGIENAPYRAANRLMASPSELAAVMGLSLTDVSALLPLVTALPESGVPVNVNTAPEMVLMSLHEDITTSIAAELVEFRKETPFEKAEDFVKKLEDDYGIKGDKKLDSKLVSVSSDYFLVSGDATIGRTSLRMYSLLQRKPDGIRVLSRSLGAY